MNVASRLVIDVARQELVDKIGRAELHARRREVRAADRSSCAARPAARGQAWLRLITRHA
jgi:hypothetical protein